MIDLSKIKLNPSEKSFRKRWLVSFYAISFSLIFTQAQSINAQSFSNPGPFSVTVPNYTGPILPGEEIIVTVRAIIVGAGGGGGRGEGAGGGGGGQVIEINFVANEGDTFTGTVGLGGTGGFLAVNGTAGGPSTFNGNTASGGSGGIGGNNGDGGASGINNGGLGSSQGNRTAGGGGAGALSSGAPGISNEPGNNASGGNGGAGRFGYGGGGGGSANKQGAGGTLILGSGVNGGTNGSTTLASNASNGGGGGGGYLRGGNGGNGRVEVSYEYARILPVEFLHFETHYSQTDRKANLYWSTAKEWENSHFQVERSINDVKSWTVIDHVTGAGYSDGPVEYAFEDKNLPASGGNIFYRLRQVDFNGKSTYSVTRAIQVDGIKGNNAWIAYPNPSRVGSEVKLALLNTANYHDESLFVQISGTQGITSSFTLSSPEEVSTAVNAQLKDAKPGIYLVKIHWGDQSALVKVIRN